MSLHFHSHWRSEDSMGNGNGDVGEKNDGKGGAGASRELRKQIRGGPVRVGVLVHENNEGNFWRGVSDCIHDSELEITGGRKSWWICTCCQTGILGAN